MQVAQLYRYPVKGLSAEALPSVVLEAGQLLPWDRAFALAQGDSGFDPAAPAFLPKSNFMCLLRNARIALLRAAWDGRVLRIQAPDGSAVSDDPLTPAGRARLGGFLTAYLGEEARGTPRFHHVPGHNFSDDRERVVSLISLDTVAALEAEVGAPRDPLRFRGNIHLSGARPWAEFTWVGRTLEIGEAALRVEKRTVRCNATQVNPDTAARDADPVRELRRAYGHAQLGVYAQVVRGGRVSVGDAVTLPS